MAPLSTIVQVSIDVLDRFPAARGFGTPLIVDPNEWFGPDLVRSYSSTREMTSDGIPSQSAVVKMAQALFSQSPSPEVVKVGRIPNATGVIPQFDFDLTLTRATIQAGTRVTVGVFGAGSDEYSFTYEVPAGGPQTNIQVADGIRLGLGNPPAGLALNTVGGGATNQLLFTSDGTVDVVYGVTFSAVDAFGRAIDPKTFFTADNQTAAMPALSTGYDNIIAEGSDFYFVLSTLQNSANIVTLATDVLADGSDTSRVYFASNQGTAFASPITTFAGQNRAVWIHSTNSFEFLDAAWVGKNAPRAPGSITWKSNELAAVGTEPYTTTQRTTVLGTDTTSRGNLYTNIGGRGVTCDGRLASGRFIDIQRGIDWLTTRIQERLFNVLENSNKVPYTDPGVAIVEAEIRGQLQEAIGQGVLAATPEPTVTVPLVANVPAATKANRILPDITFNGTLAGAVHEIVVEGTVRV